MLIFFSQTVYSKLYKLYFQNIPNLPTSQPLAKFLVSRVLPLIPSPFSPPSTQQSDGSK